ncbi:hypothetical protein N7490_003102 [Penicillium lividum]|nr:hypothetical protein N7490_003102 [Penicillium lividum]
MPPLCTDNLSSLWEDEDPIEWNIWLTTEALQDNESLEPSYYNSNNPEYSNLINKASSTVYLSQKPNYLPAPCFSNRTTHLNQSTDGEGGCMKEPPSLSTWATLLDQHSLQIEKGSQRNAPSLQEPNSQFTHVGSTNTPKQPVLISARSHGYAGCIKIICDITTGETLTDSQARNIKNCGDDLVKSMRSEEAVTNLKYLLVECHQNALLSVDSDSFDSSLTACVVYLSYTNSITGSSSYLNDVRRRLAQVWLHIHFENMINYLATSEKNGFPMKRNGRSISTIARDSILQAIHGHQFSPRKTDRDLLSDQCRWGERWWKVATCIGLGVLLLASEDLANQIGKRTAFQNKMVDTLAIYIFNRYPSLADLYQMFEPLVVGLMLSGDRICSRKEENYFLEALLKSGTHEPKKLEEWHLLNPKSESQLAASRLISLQRPQAMTTIERC